MPAKMKLKRKTAPKLREWTGYMGLYSSRRISHAFYETRREAVANFGQDWVIRVRITEEPNPCPRK